MESKITEFFGDGALQEVEIESIPSGTKTKRKIDGVFIFIGAGDFIHFVHARDSTRHF